MSKEIITTTWQEYATKTSELLNSTIITSRETEETWIERDRFLEINM